MFTDKVGIVNTVNMDTSGFYTYNQNFRMGDDILCDCTHGVLL